MIQSGDAKALQQIEQSFLPDCGIFSPDRGVKVISATPTAIQFHAAIRTAEESTKFVNITCKPTIRAGNSTGWSVTARVGKRVFSDLQQLVAYALNRSVKITAEGLIAVIDGEE